MVPIVCNSPSARVSRRGPSYFQHLSCDNSWKEAATPRAHGHCAGSRPEPRQTDSIEARAIGRVDLVHTAEHRSRFVFAQNFACCSAVIRYLGRQRRLGIITKIKADGHATRSSMYGLC